MSSPRQFTTVDYVEPHAARAKEMLKKHPELKCLFGNTPSTALYVIGCVVAQVALAAYVSDKSFWVMLALSWCVGAVIDHALWTLIHDATHNLVFKSSNANRWLAIVANFPIFFPGAIAFRVYHLHHHRYQGVVDMDADLAIPLEAKLAANPIGKALWLFFFWVFQPIRVSKLKRIRFLDRWFVANWTIQVAFLSATVYFLGWTAFAYFFFSGSFAVGLHPLGARWIQEHYVFDVEKTPHQETYSYYGPANRIAFNVGFHNEHHDLMVVPWSRLPQVRAMAPEYYDTLAYHSSWTVLFFRFLFDPSITLYNRIVRSPRKAVERGNFAQQPIPIPEPGLI